MKRLAAWVFLCVVFAIGPQPSDAATRPNILFLFSDDQRADTIAALGNRHIKTPNLDRLVKQGTAFTRAYCMGSTVGAVCVPSRAMLLSGRSLFRAPNDFKGAGMWPELMRAEGYVTFGTGKWHNGSPSFARGFSDGGAIFMGGMCDHFKVPICGFDPTGRYGKELRRTGTKFSSELFADAAIEFLSRHDGRQPFFLYVSFTAPHDPRTPPGAYASLYKPAKLPLPRNFLPSHPFDNGELVIRDEELAPQPRTPQIVRQHLADYYGMITHMDEQIGRILDTLEQTGLAKNTLVVFTSDHGLGVGSHGLLGKQNLYEHSMGAPLIFFGPGIPRGRKSVALCYLFDVLPTVAEFANLPALAGSEGRSLKPVLDGRSKTGRDAIFLAYRDVQRAIVTDRWKLIHYPQIGRTQLFDLKSDPYEVKDLSGQRRHADRVKELMEQLGKAQQEFADPLVQQGSAGTSQYNFNFRNSPVQSGG